jgi:hypothetical protein
MALRDLIERIIRPATLGHAEDGGTPPLFGAGGGTDSGPVVRNFPDGTLRVMKPGTKGENPEDWQIIGVSPPPAAKAQSAPDIEYDAQGRAWTWNGTNYQSAPTFDNPTKAAGYQAPRAAPTYAPQYPEGGVTGTGQTYTRDPYTGRITLGPVYSELASQFGPQQQRDFTLADLAAQRAYSTGERLAGQQYGTGERLGSQAYNTGERIAGQDFAAGESALGRQFSGEESRLSRLFSSGENALSRAFSGEEGYLDRTQRASEFLSTYEISRAQEERAARDAALRAAETFTALSASPDLGGYQRFLAAGGGSVGNAIQRGATSLTREGQLGAGRALQVSEQPVRVLPDYAFTPQRNAQANAQNPYAGMANQFAAMQAPVVPKPAPLRPLTSSTFAPPPSAPAVEAYGGGAGNITQSARDAFGAANPGYADQLAAFKAVEEQQNTPRFAMGTGDMPAPQQFISGDAPATDPAAGGARPELVSVDDPEGNARLSVDPLMPEGMMQPGESEFGPSGPQRMGALFHAIGDFLDGGEKPMGEFGPPPMMGGGMMDEGMPPRFAYGTPDVHTQPMPFTALGPSTATATTPGDDPYIDRVLKMRQQTPYEMNTFAADYFNQSPTVRSINETGAQVATGVPASEFGWEAARYRPGMLSRDSLSLGV